MKTSRALCYTTALKFIKHLQLNKTDKILCSHDKTFKKPDLSSSNIKTQTVEEIMPKSITPHETENKTQCRL